MTVRPLGGGSGTTAARHTRSTFFGATTARAETMDRIQANAGSQTLTAGSAFFGYIDPPVSLTVTKLGIYSRGTAAAGTTLARMGIYSIDGSGNGTLLARTASDTTLMNTTFNLHERSLDTTGGFAASVTFTPGTRYALAILLVGSTTAAVSYGSGLPSLLAAMDPRIASIMTSQTDLPTAPTAANLSATAPTQMVHMYAAP